METRQLETDLGFETDCGTDDTIMALCLSLYSRGDSEKTRLKAFVNEACDS